MEFEVVFSPTANEDLVEILEWFSDRAPEKCAEWLDALELKISSLTSMPERCPLAPENGRWGSDEIRSLLFDDYPSKYRILFSIADQEVRILNIRHGARRYLYEDM